MLPGLDVAGPGCRRWPFATCATRYLPYGHLPVVVQADLGGPRWVIDISNMDVAFEQTCCVETILILLFYIPMEVTNLLCVDSRCHTRRSV